MSSHSATSWPLPTARGTLSSMTSSSSTSSSQARLDSIPATTGQASQDDAAGSSPQAPRRSSIAESIIARNEDDADEDAAAEQQQDDDDAGPAASSNNANDPQPKTWTTQWGQKTQRPDGSFDWHQHSRAQPLHGELEVSSDTSHWSRIFTGMRDIAEAVALFDDLEPKGRQGKLGDDDWQRAKALDGLGVARAILKECGKKGGHRLSERAFWWALRAEAVKICDLPVTLEQHKSGLLRGPKTGGLYLTIGLLRRLLRAIYVGRSGLLGSRAMDHLDDLLASSNGASTGTLLYDILPHCERQ